MQKKIFIVGEGPNMEPYEKAVAQAGGIPIVSLFLEDAADCDALLIPGGVDVHPSRYGQEVNGSKNMNETLDAAQFAILDYFVPQKKPIFGICRGHQLLNVYFGGTLIQDLANAEVHTNGTWENYHASAILPGTFLWKLYGESAQINSRHHQAVDRLAEDFIPIQHSPEGIVDAMMHKSLPIISVQWHPEQMAYELKKDNAADGGVLFEYFMKGI